MQAQQATVRGVAMRWTEAGEGFPVVLVHGIPTSPALWRHVLPQVRGGRLLVLLARGHDEPAIARESLAIHLEPYQRHGGAAALAGQVRWLRTADTLRVADRLRDLDVPARVVWGAADRFQRLPYGERPAWDLRTELWPIEGGRHFVPEDHPARVAAAINQVLDAAGPG